jgi:hypothetical protein
MVFSYNKNTERLLNSVKSHIDLINKNLTPLDSMPNYPFFCSKGTFLPRKQYLKIVSNFQNSTLLFHTESFMFITKCFLLSPEIYAAQSCILSDKTMFRQLRWRSHTYSYRKHSELKGPEIDKTEEWIWRLNVRSPHLLKLLTYYIFEFSHNPKVLIEL